MVLTEMQSKEAKKVLSGFFQEMDLLYVCIRKIKLELKKIKADGPTEILDTCVIMATEHLKSARTLYNNFRSYFTDVESFNTFIETHLHISDLILLDAFAKDTDDGDSLLTECSKFLSMYQSLYLKSTKVSV